MRQLKQGSNARGARREPEQAETYGPWRALSKRECHPAEEKEHNRQTEPSAGDESSLHQQFTAEAQLCFKPWWQKLEDRTASEGDGLGKCQAGCNDERHSQNVERPCAGLRLHDEHIPKEKWSGDEKKAGRKDHGGNRRGDCGAAECGHICGNGKCERGGHQLKYGQADTQGHTDKWEVNGSISWRPLSHSFDFSQALLFVFEGSERTVRRCFLALLTTPRAEITLSAFP